MLNRSDIWGSRDSLCLKGTKTRSSLGAKLFKSCSGQSMRGFFLNGPNGKCLREFLMHHHVFTDVVQKYYAEVDKGDVDGVVALFEVDAEYSRPGYAHLSGREAIKSFYVDDRIIESGMHNIESIVSDSGTVAVEGSFKGTVRGGTDAEVKFADFFWPGPNGLIKKRRTYFYAPLI
jgi:ketosteroid isomerase-like protein